MPEWRDELRARLTGAGLAPGTEAEVIEELAQHLDDQFAELSGRLGPVAARAALLAQLDQGGLDRALRRRARRDHPSPVHIGAPPRAAGIVRSVFYDLRYAVRSLRRARAFTAVAVLSLATGIGASTAIFGLLDTVLLRKLAVRSPDQLVELRKESGRGQFDLFATAEYETLKRAPGLPRAEADANYGVTVVIGEGRDYPQGDFVTGGFFDMLGVHPLRGRLISPDDDRSRAPVAVVSQDFWEKQLAGDTAVLGRRLTVDGRAYTIVGVLPRDFRGMQFGGAFSIAMPLSTAAAGQPVTPNSRSNLVNIFARLAPGQTIEAGARAFDAVFQACCAAVPLPGAPNVKGLGDARLHLLAVEANRGVASLKVDLREEYRLVLTALMAGVGVLLLIACANVGNLLLARASARRRELAVRISMGATRGRIIRQLLVESLLLAIAGGALGVVLARIGTGVLAHNLPTIASNLSDSIVLRPSPAILGFAILTTLGATLLFGVLPAIRATRADLMSPLKDGAAGSGMGGGRASVDRGIVVAQVALALVLICGAGLFAATLRNLRNFEQRPNPSHVLLMNLDARGTVYDARGMRPLYQPMLERIRHLPGVENAVFSSTTPVFGGRYSRDFIRVPGFEPSGDDDYSASYDAVGPEFFATMGIRIERGRAFDEHDSHDAAKVAIVSRAFAKHFFGDRDPLGKTINLGQGADAEPIQIVGLAGDAHYDGLRRPPTEIFYGPLAQDDNWPLLVLTVRANRDAAAFVPTLRNAIDAAAPGIRIRRVADFEQAVDEELARERLAAGLAGLFGLLALGLAAVGLYGVVAYNVSRRTQEIGLRMALGARSADVLMMVVRNALTMTGVGVVIGVPLALLAGRAVTTQLYGVRAADPRFLVGAAVLLFVVGIIAAVLPGRRAARVDPVEALRSE